MVIFIALSNRASQSELYHNEYVDDDTLPRESITYTVDGMKKEILTSDSDEICVKIPRWEELTTVYMTEDSKEILVHFRWDSAEWFLCEKDSTGTIRAQKGITIFHKDTSEPYFLSYQGNPYLCLVDRNAEGEVENVALYDFITRTISEHLSIWMLLRCVFAHMYAMRELTERESRGICILGMILIVGKSIMLFWDSGK